MTNHIHNSGREAYQTHNPIDTFVRYTQNDFLLNTIATLASRQGVKRVLDIGSSGRYSVLFYSIPEIFFLNFSQVQLDLSQDLFLRLSRLFESRLFKEKIESVIELPWLKDLSESNRQRVLRDIETQLGFVEQYNPTPVSHTISKIPILFSENNPELKDSYFDFVTMIDILPHIPAERIQGHLRDLFRLMVSPGVAIVTFFPNKKSYKEDGSVPVDEIFRDIILEYHIDVNTPVYDEQTQGVHPSSIKPSLISKLDPINYETLSQRYWMDLDVFYLQSANQIIECALKEGFEIEELLDVPGGMFRACRKAIILFKP